jgi:hypothetical protein
MRNLPGLLPFVLLALFLSESGLATSPTPSPTSEDLDDLLGFFTGSYRLISKELDSKIDPKTGVPIDTKNPGLEALFPEAPLKQSE